MILIVVAAIVGITVLIAVLLYLLGFAVLAVVLWAATDFIPAQ